MKEVEIIASTVRALVKALSSEKQTLVSLVQLCEQFSCRADQLHPWLNNRPDVSSMQSLMKEIKTLRSKLRHKLADRRDMEEVANEHVRMLLRVIDREVKIYLEEAYL